VRAETAPGAPNIAAQWHPNNSVTSGHRKPFLVVDELDEDEKTPPALSPGDADLRPLDPIAEQKQTTHMPMETQGSSSLRNRAARAAQTLAITFPEARS